MGALSANEVSYIEGGIGQNLRSDGRGRQDFRHISIVTGVIPQVILLTTTRRYAEHFLLYAVLLLTSKVCFLLIQALAL